MNIIDMPCSAVNYGGIRGQKVKYLVVHYTAGRNDTAQNNGHYFANNSVGASAHYFVDENTVVRSVPEERVAWHCGGSVYFHDECRNSNSIGVEICCKWDGREYSFAEAAVENAKTLVRELMAKYGIPTERVLRHWDITRKICPAPFVGAGAAAWKEFKGGLTVYPNIENVPDWAKPSVQKLIDKGVLNGDGTGLNLSQDLTRTLVILDRLGIFEMKR